LQARSAQNTKQTAGVTRINKRLQISHSDNKTYKKYHTHHIPLSLRDADRDVGGRATHGAVAEKAGERR
jgi:hypothetical protein